MFKTILVATDGSNHARKAVELASDMAATYGAKLIVFHVAQRNHLPDEDRRLAEVEAFVAPPAGRRFYADEFAERSTPAPRRQGAEAAARIRQPPGERILAEAEEVAKRRGVKDVRTAVGDGDPASRIVRRAEREAADLIVIGCRGLGAFEGLLLGSVSRKVCQLAKCPCLTVK